MPIGAFKLNGIAKYIAPISVTSARAGNAVYTITAGTPTVITSGGQFTGYISYDQDESADITIKPSSSTWYFNSTNAWTCEWWWKKSGTYSATTSAIWLPNGLSNLAFSLEIINATQYTITLSSTVIYTGTFPTSWQHFALVSNGSSNLKVFVGGTQVASVSYTRSDSIRKFGLNSAGFGATATLQFDELRISNNARYTGAFTPSASAFTNDSNTLALFHFDTNTLDDSEISYVYNRYSGIIAATGGAVLNTTSKKFGTASLDVSMSGSGGFTSDSVALQNLTGNYTIEFWAMIPTNPITTQRALLRSDTGTGLSNSVSLRPQGSNIYDIEYSFSGDNWNSNGGAGMTWTAGTWYHCCIMRSGTNVGIFFNGSRKSSRTSAHTRPFSNPTSAATLGVNTGGNQIMIDSLRISNNARYTYGTTITVPTAEFASDANTIVLHNFNGTNGSISFPETT